MIATADLAVNVVQSSYHMEYVNVTKDVDVELVVNALVHAVQKISK